MTASAHHILGEERRDLEAKRSPRICLQCGGPVDDYPVAGIKLGDCCLPIFKGSRLTHTTNKHRRFRQTKVERAERASRRKRVPA